MARQEMAFHASMTLSLIDYSNADSDFSVECMCGWHYTSQMQMSCVSEWNAHRVRKSYAAQFTGV